MNILPHKSWHVRTKKNIERVRKDEAEAAEKEKEVQRRIQLAAQESRTTFLRERAGQRVQETGEDLPIPLGEVADLTQSDGHINFFQEIEDGKKQDTGINKEHEADKKKESEEYEKKIGVLVYLGQNSIEESKNRPWYESVERHSIPRTSSSATAEEKAAQEAKEVKQNKLRDFEDPLKEIRKYISTPGIQKKFGSAPTTLPAISADTSYPSLKRKSDTKPSPTTRKHKKTKKEKKNKSKKHKSKKSKHHHHHRHNTSASEDSETDSEDEKKRQSLEKLRSERLAREREERRKADKLLANLRGDPIPEPEVSDLAGPIRDVQTSGNHSKEFREPSRVKQKYNSQFNPELARQNYEKN